MQLYTSVSRYLFITKLHVWCMCCNIDDCYWTGCNTGSRGVPHKAYMVPFREKCLVENERSVTFPQPRLKLKTFADRKLVKKLKSVCAEIPSLTKVPVKPGNTGYIIDGMALQSLNESFFKTFDNLSQQVLKKILKLLEKEDLGIGVGTLLFDRYDQDDLINQLERRAEALGKQHLVIRLTMPVKYLQGSAKVAVNQFPPTEQSHHAGWWIR